MASQFQVEGVFKLRAEGQAATKAAVDSVTDSTRRLADAEREAINGENAARTTAVAHRQALAELNAEIGRNRAAYDAADISAREFLSRQASLNRQIADLSGQTSAATTQTERLFASLRRFLGLGSLFAGITKGLNDLRERARKAREANSELADTLERAASTAESAQNRISAVFGLIAVSFLELFNFVRQLPVLVTQAFASANVALGEFMLRLPLIGRFFGEDITRGINAARTASIDAGDAWVRLKEDQDALIESARVLRETILGQAASVNSLSDSVGQAGPIVTVYRNSVREVAEASHEIGEESEFAAAGVDVLTQSIDRATAAQQRFNAVSSATRDRNRIAVPGGSRLRSTPGLGGSRRTSSLSPGLSGGQFGSI